jgi:RNA polymerase sigma factor (sigma-70 family)
VRRGPIATPRPPERQRHHRNADLHDRLLRRHRAALSRQARFHSERRQDAEDAVGDACVQFLLRFDGEGTEQARRWMLVVVRRCAWAIARRRRERRAVVVEVSAESVESQLGLAVAEGRRGPAELVGAAEEVAAFTRALATLRPDERRALILLALGSSYAEIGGLCGWSYGKVNRSIAEGRARLRAILGEGG